MGFISSIIGVPLGWIMWLIFQLVRNYGVALLLFTLFSRLLTLPVTINQQKSTAKMSMIQPQLAELQKKYANNKQKLNEEMMSLYNKAGYNPMSGCLPMVLQFVILFGIIDVIYNPLNHILHLDATTIQAAIDIMSGIVTETVNANQAQMLVVREVAANPAAFASLGQEAVQTILGFVPQLSFLGIDLTITPVPGMFLDIFKGSFNLVLLVPIFSGITSLLLSLNTLRTTAATTAGQAGSGGMKGMMLIMPIFSTWFTTQVPAGVGLYWTYSNVIGLVQNLLMHRLYNPKEMAAKAQAEFEEAKERERLERIEAKKRAKESGEDDDKALSKKEANRRKLAEARKRDAEKYGEDYQEVTDDDLS